MSKRAVVLTGICLLTVLVFFAAWAALPKSGMEQLALILPWLLMLGTHVVLGPVALFLAIRTGRHARHAWLYLYFLVFAGVHAHQFVLQSGLVRWAVDRCERIAHPEEYALSQALEQARRQSQLGRPLDESDRARLLGLARQTPRIERSFDRFPLHPLTLAAGLGDMDLVDALLERGADPDGTPRPNDAPLLAAADALDVAIVRRLLDGGANASRQDAAGENALLKLVRAGVRETVPQLLAAGADPDAESRRDITRPLVLAVRRGDPELVRWLLEAGADPEVKTISGDNLGTIAAEAGHVEVFRLLVEAGLSLKEGRSTSLHRAATDGDLDRLERLLDAGADPDILDDGGGTPLLAVAAHRQQDPPEAEAETAVQAARLLIRHGANVSFRSGDGRSALVVAASRPERLAFCRLLLASGADANARDGDDGRTALIHAARAGETALVRLLLESGADPNAASEGMNRTHPLVEALRGGHIDVVRMLIAAGSWVPPPARFWGDAFQHAAPHPELVTLLARRAANLDVADEMGRRPLDQVRRFGVPESVDVILAAGASPNPSRR